MSCRPFSITSRHDNIPHDHHSQAYIPLETFPRENSGHASTFPGVQESPANTDEIVEEAGGNDGRPL